MKKILIIVLILIIMSLSYILYSNFFDMNRLPSGSLISEENSPEGTYTIKFYRVNGGATTSYGIRGELNFNTVKRNSKNIYWNYGEDEVIINWINDNKVLINGIELNLPNEKFDFRRKK